MKIFWVHPVKQNIKPTSPVSSYFFIDTYLALCFHWSERLQTYLEDMWEVSRNALSLVRSLEPPVASTSIKEAFTFQVLFPERLA